MINLTFTRLMDLHLKKYPDLEQYSKPPKQPWILHDYYFDDVDTHVLVYDNNTISITGDCEQDFYQELVLNCGETDFVGMDEVGVGDFFGPVVYVSVKLTEESIQKLSTTFIDIRDSKRLKTKKIFELCNIIGQVVDYKYQVIYDVDMQQNYNAVEQKVVYHNKNLFEESANTIVDLFTTERAFYKYSNDLNLTWPKNIILENKADSNYLCVALASILARGIYLFEMLRIHQKYPLVPLALGGNVLDVAQEFKDTYGMDALAEVCKTSFKTFDLVE